MNYSTYMSMQILYMECCFFFLPLFVSLLLQLFETLLLPKSLLLFLPAARPLAVACVFISTIWCCWHHWWDSYSCLPINYYYVFAAASATGPLLASLQLPVTYVYLQLRLAPLQLLKSLLQAGVHAVASAPVDYKRPRYICAMFSNSLPASIDVPVAVSPCCNNGLFLGAFCCWCLY